VLAVLAEHGLLLLQDPRLPSVVALVAGEASPRASWWSHPKARVMFAVLRALGEHEDVLFTKLLLGKVTLVHRALWPGFLAVAGSGAEWQTRQLSSAARRLRQRVAREGAVTTHGAAVKELELALLVRVEEVHTESGRHALRLESWASWARRRRVRALRSLPRARRELEAAAAALGAPLTALPWPAEDGGP
jgi:hypothetical protein